MIKELIGLFGIIVIIILSFLFAILCDLFALLSNLFDYLETWIWGQAQILHKWVTGEDMPQ